jgi:lipid II:glycine glycyltransferase (peptidoglycan interpeptide bridge formation enzyme)
MSNFIDITDEKKEDFNKIVSHPLQSFEWGEFRKKTGVKVIRRGLLKNKKIIDGFTLTLHKIPKTKYYIGYLPKGNEPTGEILEELKRIGIQENCVFIQLEPNLVNGQWSMVNGSNLVPAARPLFTKYSFILDLTPNEEELLSKMHSKTRYNIRVAERHGVKVVENNSEESFEQYIKLMLETTGRQGFYAHTPKYHKDMFEILPKKAAPNALSYHLFNALYKPDDSQLSPLTLTSWVLFVFHDHLYYPYGASSRLYRETMSNNLTAWEAIKFGKKLGLKKFDMWGALGPDPDKNDPWYGFHRFKEGYGATLTEFVGSYDLIIRPQSYSLYKLADRARWGFLKIKKSLKM